MTVPLPTKEGTNDCQSVKSVSERATAHTIFYNLIADYLAFAVAVCGVAKAEKLYCALLFWHFRCHKAELNSESWKIS